MEKALDGGKPLDKTCFSVFSGVVIHLKNLHILSIG
jgi:hypothetical protein